MSRNLTTFLGRKYPTKVSKKREHIDTKAELLQLYHTEFPSLGIFVSKKVGN